ncbi:MAG: hypothetical protein QM758_17110 [Armatimonas sp.]
MGLVSPQKEGGQLTFAAAEGPGFPPGTLLTSPTTRTRGLIGAIDLTPEGLPVQAKPGTVAELLKFKWRIEATEASKDAVLGVYGALAGIGLLLGIAATYRKKFVYQVQGLLAIGAAGPTALLLSPLVAPADTGLQILCFLLASVVLTLLAQIAGRRQYPVRNLLRLLIVVIFIDTIGHFGLIANSALSAYYISGIRFYGIGNEYMGLLLGAVIMCVPLSWMAYMAIATALLLGLSPLGADAGGAVVATAALIPWPALPLSSPPQLGKWVKPIAVRVTLGVGVAILLALLERYVLPADQRSHIGRAAGGGGALWGEIILRKIRMNLRLSTVPWTLMGLVGVGGATIWLAKSPVGAHIKRSPELSQRVAQALLAAIATAVFNDSGVIAALLLLAPVLFTVVESALCATSELIMEPSESVSP